MLLGSMMEDLDLQRAIIASLESVQFVASRAQPRQMPWAVAGPSPSTHVVSSAAGAPNMRRNQWTPTQIFPADEEVRIPCHGWEGEAEHGAARRRQRNTLGHLQREGIRPRGGWTQGEQMQRQQRASYSPQGVSLPECDQGAELMQRIVPPPTSDRNRCRNWLGVIDPVPYGPPEERPLKRPSDAVPGWAEVPYGGGRVQRQNVDGTHLLLLTEELGERELRTVYQSDMLMLRSNAAIHASQERTCISAIVQHLGGRGHHVLFGIGLKSTFAEDDGYSDGDSENDGDENNDSEDARNDNEKAKGVADDGGPLDCVPSSSSQLRDSGKNKRKSSDVFPAVVLRYDALGGVFICMEKWRHTSKGACKRISVLEPCVPARLQRDRVALSVVFTSEGLTTVFVNNEISHAAVQMNPLEGTAVTPVLFIAGGKVSVRDLSVVVGDEPPKPKVHQRLPPSSSGPVHGGARQQHRNPRKTTATAASLATRMDATGCGNRKKVTTDHPSDNRTSNAPPSPSGNRLHPQHGAVSSRRAATEAERGRASKNVTQAHRSAKPRASGTSEVKHAPPVDTALAEVIETNIMERSPNVEWDDIVGIPQAKELLKEAAILPVLLPELFTGIVQPWKGVLLFGPPGTGKTMLARAVATSAKTTFFNVSTSQLLSKHYGESEKLVRTLFQLARRYAPSTIFFDEVDALMSKRGAGEHEASRRVKSEMLQQIDGLASDGDERVMVLATSNHPWDLDEAMRRRLEKRIYIPLPDTAGRVEMLRKMTEKATLHVDVDLDMIAEGTANFSGADINVMVREAAMAGVRRLLRGKSPAELAEMKANGQLHRGDITVADLLSAMEKTQPSVSLDSIVHYQKWSAEFGST